MYHVFPKEKSIFTPGVATRLAVVFTAKVGQVITSAWPFYAFAYYQNIYEPRCEKTGLRVLHVLTFAKPECDNVLQPYASRGEGCNTLLHEGLANVRIHGT